MRRSKPRVLDSADQRTAELVKLRQQLATRDLGIRLLEKIRQASLASPSPDRLFSRLLTAVMQVTTADGGLLLTLDGDGARSGTGVARARGQSITRGPISVDSRLQRQALRTRRALIRRNLRRGPAALLILPLMIGTAPVGLLELSWRGNDRGPDRIDPGIITALGQELGITLERARLSHQANQQVEQLSTLIQLSQILNSTLRQDEVLRRTTIAATQLMRCEVGSLLLLDEAGEELRFRVALGEHGEEMRTVRLKVGEGIAGWVAKRGKPAIVNDVRKDPRFARYVDRRSGFETHNMICVPVSSRDRIIGVLQAINRLEHAPFRPEDVDLFLALSHQVAIAIENARLYEKVKETFLGTVSTLAEAIEKRDPYTGGHVRRVVELSMAIGKQLRLPPEELDHLELAAILHDVGKIGIRDEILQKNAPLNKRERAAMQQHPRLGAEILRPIRQLQEVIPAVRHHQERFDGRGYPDGLKGSAIPMASRIIAVADTFDAMTTDRPYRPRISDAAALAEIKRYAGSQFDPAIVRAFLALKETASGRAVRRSEQGWIPLGLPQGQERVAPSERSATIRYRVLGCYGSESPGFHLASFLIDDTVLIDAGSVTATLDVMGQAQIRHILLTHSHLDHVRDLAHLADNVFGLGGKRVTVYSIEAVLESVRTLLFNNVVWPDFTTIPTSRDSILDFCPLKEEVPVPLGHLRVTPVCLAHTVDTVGYLIEQGDVAILHVADTGPCDRIWTVANNTPNLRAVIIEATFPNRLQDLAATSGHLTPLALKRELTKLRAQVPVYIHHLKPQYAEEIRSELREMLPDSHLLEQGREYLF